MAAWDDTTFCTYDDIVNKRLSEGALVSLFESEDRAKTRQRVQSFIHDVVQQEVRPKVVAFLANKYPNRSADVIALRNRLEQEAKDQISRVRMLNGTNAIVPPEGVIDSDNDDDEETQTTGDYPQVFLTSGAPTSGSSGDYAGTAKNGAYLIDTEVNKTYINRGTLDIPTWEPWIIKELVDLLLNPECLTYAVASGVVWKIYEYAESIQSPHFLDRMDVIGKKTKEKKAFFHEKLNVALQDLECDLSGDGQINEFEQSDDGEEDDWA